MKNVPLKLEKLEEKITARTGLLLYSRLGNVFGLEKKIEELFPASNSAREYSAYSYVKTLLLTLYGGGESISDTKEIREDIALRRGEGLTTVPSDSAIYKWLKRKTLNRKAINAIKTINSYVVKNILEKKKIREVAVSVDPTIVYAEKQDAKYTYEGKKGYRPCLVFINELNIIAYAQFKEGNDNGGRFAIVSEVIKQIENEFHVKVTRIFADSEFYVNNIFSFAEQKNITYYIAVNKDESVMESIKSINENDWKEFRDKDDVLTKKQIASTVHVMQKCRYPLRMVVLRWKDKEENLCYHAITTNADDLSVPDQTVVFNYNQRAAQENTIKELKNGFGMRKMPSGDFLANALFFQIGVLAYNLFIAQKILVLGRKYRRKTIKSIRWLLLQIPAQIIQMKQFVVARIAATEQKFKEIIAIKEATDALSFDL